MTSDLLIQMMNAALAIVAVLIVGGATVLAMVMLELAAINAVSQDANARVFGEVSTQ